MSRSLAKQGSTGGTFEVRTAAADNLDDILSMAQKNQDVKPFIEILSDIYEGIKKGTTVRWSKNPISAHDLAGVLVANGFLQSTSEEKVY